MVRRLNTKRMCTCSNGFQVKLELSQLEQWISKTLQLPEIKYPLRLPSCPVEYVDED